MTDTPARCPLCGSERTKLYPSTIGPNCVGECTDCGFTCLIQNADEIKFREAWAKMGEWRLLAAYKHSDQSIGAEAADEIERLYALVGEMRDALEAIEGGYTDRYPGAPDFMVLPRADFRGDMWAWSQKVARAAIAKADEVLK